MSFGRVHANSVDRYPPGLYEKLHEPQSDGVATDEEVANSAQEKMEDEAADEDAQGTLFSSVITLANSAIGAGVLAFPYAFKEAGFAAALIVTVGLCLVMGMCIHIIATSCELMPHCKTYNSMVRAYFGKRVGAGFEMVLIMYLFGSCIGYMIIVYDMFQPVLEKIYTSAVPDYTTDDAFYSTVVKNNSFSSRAIVIGFWAVAVMLPLSLLRKISALKFSSALAVFSVVYMSSLVSVKSVIHTSAQGVGPNIAWSFNDVVGLATAVPLLCFAFQCQINVPPIYAEMRPELREDGVRNFDKISVLAYIICITLYLPCGIFGYLYFGDLTPSDVLKSATIGASPPDGFDQDDMAILASRLCIMCAVMCCYPLNHYPARAAIYSLMFTEEKPEAEARQRNSMTTPEILSQHYPRWTESPVKAASTSSAEHNTTRWNKFFYIETVAFVGCNLVLAVLIQDLSYVMDICGSTAATIVIFVIPSQFLRERSEGDWKSMAFSWFLLVLGVVIMVVCLATTILRMAGVLEG